MKSLLAKHTFLFVSLVMLSVSCSTTRTLSEGEYRLAKNSISVVNSEDFNPGALSQYVKQDANRYFLFGWNPFLNLYNLADKENESGWARFCRKIGTAPVIYDPDAVNSTIDNIENHLEYSGYYNSTVKGNVNVEKKKVFVDYFITLGKRYSIDSLSFTIPERGTFKTDFQDDIPNISIHKGDFLSEETLEQETVRGEAHFRDMGYFGFSKNNYVFEADTTSVPGKLFLNMIINEYTRNESETNARPLRKFYIDSVSISYPQSLSIKEKTIKNLNLIKPGDLYKESTINASYARLSSLRMFNSVSIGMTQTDTNLVNCGINLSQSRIQGFKANLEASSNSTGLMGVSPQVSFYHKNIFHGGELLNLSFMGNFQFKFNDPIRSDEFGVNASLSLPRFIGLPNRLFTGPNMPRTEISASYNYQDRPEYTRTIISTSFGYTGAYKKLSYQIYPAQLSIIRLDNMDESFYETLSRNPFMRYAYQDHFDAGLGSMLYFSSTTETNPSESFHYARIGTDLSGNLLSLLKPMLKKDKEGAGLIWGIPFSQYVKGEVTLGQTWIFGRDKGQAIATRLLAGIGYAYGNSSAIPFEKQFYSGGANSMRGWQARSLGPGCSPVDSTFTIPSQTGDMKFEANLEYRFKLFWKIAGAIFIDAGNIWTVKQFSDSDISSLNGQKTFQSIALDWGTGVRVDLKFLILRLDTGFKLHDPSRIDNKWLSPGEWHRKNGYAIHFGVGYPF